MLVMSLKMEKRHSATILRDGGIYAGGKNAYCAKLEAPDNERVHETICRRCTNNPLNPRFTLQQSHLRIMKMIKAFLNVQI